MNGLGREEAPFSGRVWQEIDRVVHAVREANCTARRFLEVDGPYGLALTSVAGDEEWLAPLPSGADFDAWNVTRPEDRLVPGPSQAPGRRAHLVPRVTGDIPDRVGAGTHLVHGGARHVPLIASEFSLSMRAIEAFEAGCQPLDLFRATRAARDVALEEERFLYYGHVGDPALLEIINVSREEQNVSPRGTAAVIDALTEAVTALAGRGYAGPFALVAEPVLYRALYSPSPRDVLLVDLIRGLFRGGIHLAPVINSMRDAQARRGAVVTVGCAYSRLVVGQDWVTAYRGRDGMLYRFLIMSSLQLRICDPRSIQVLV